MPEIERRLPRSQKVMSSLKDKIARTLSQKKKRKITNTALKKAAVLIPLFKKNGDYYVLLMKRTEEVEYHKGQISFPGGGQDDGDKTIIDTALRETFEEIGLEPRNIEVLGELDDRITAISNFIVSPFVAFIPYPYLFILNRREVQELIEVPLSAFLAPDSFKEKPVQGSRRKAYFVYYGGHVIWGATAGIMKHFVDLLLAAGVDLYGK